MGSRSTLAALFTVATYLICIATVLAGFGLYRSVRLWRNKEQSLLLLLANIVWLIINLLYTIHKLTHSSH